MFGMATTTDPTGEHNLRGLPHRQNVKSSVAYCICLVTAGAKDS